MDKKENVERNEKKKWNKPWRKLKKNECDARRISCEERSFLQIEFNKFMRRKKYFKKNLLLKMKLSPISSIQWKFIWNATNWCTEFCSVLQDTVQIEHLFNNLIGIAIWQSTICLFKKNAYYWQLELFWFASAHFERIRKL